jgi:hypothetical protein
MGQDSLVSKGTGYRLEGQGWIPGKEMFRPDLDPTQPLIQWIPRAIYLVTKWPEYDADHSHSI